MSGTRSVRAKFRDPLCTSRAHSCNTRRIPAPSIFGGASTAHKTVSVGMTSELIRGDVFAWGQLMAGALIGVLPAIVAYFFFVEYYVAGLSGSVKE